MELLKKLTAIGLGLTLIMGSTFALADSGVVVASGGLNLRNGAGTSYSKIVTIPSGAVVNVIGWQDGWSQVTYNGQTGFVLDDYISFRSDNATSRTGGVRAGAEVVNVAKQYLGTPYVYGGSSPSGFDCSGFTSYVYSKMGYSINRTAAGQASNGVEVAKSELLPGDLIMFRNGGSGIGHVGIYAGGGQMIHSVKSGVPVRYDSINSSYYSNNYVTARRIIN